MMVNFYQTAWRHIPEDSIVTWRLEAGTVEQIEAVIATQWNSEHASAAKIRTKNLSNTGLENYGYTSLFSSCVLSLHKRQTD
jgi:hypothetical protein